MPDHLLTERQAAQLLGLSVKTLQARRFNRLGPSYVKLGRSVRYTSVDLENFINSNRIQIEKEMNNAA